MALDKTKTDPALGEEIHQYLLDCGVETPMRKFPLAERGDKYDTIYRSVTNIMEALELDLSDDSLKETPKRVTRMFLDEIYWGLDYKNFPKITTIENKMQYDSMLMERRIKLASSCEHHLVTIIGEAYVAYIPNEKVIGLSKINRIVEFFSRRPQVQERLTEQIFHTLCYILDTDNVAVLIQAEHFCVKARGVEDMNSNTVTARLGGNFMESTALRNEFYSSIKL